MADVAALGIKVTETGVVTTTNALTKFAAAAKAAGAAASKPLVVKASASSAKALAEIRQLEKALAGIKKTSTTRVSVDAASAIAELNKVTAAAERAKKASSFSAKASVSSGGGPSSADIGAVNSLKGAVLGLVSAYALLQGAQAYVRLADGAKLLTAQLRLATSESGSFAKAQEDVRNIATNVRTDLASTAALYGKLMLNSKQLGISQQEAARATETVGKAFKISGASTVEAAQGTRQLVQALQSGVLRGDEFNTMAEAAPRLQKLLADSLGVTQGELRKMAEEGELTSAKLTAAFTDKEFTKGLDEEFKKLPVTFGDAVTQMQNSMQILIGAFDEGAGLTKALSEAILGTSKDMQSMEADARKLGQQVRAEFIGMQSGASELISMIGNLASRWMSETSKMDAALSPVVAGLQAIITLTKSTTSSAWSNGIVNGAKVAFSYLMPLNALMVALGMNAKNAETARQNKEFDGGFAGRYLDKWGDRLGGGSSAGGGGAAAADKATKATKGHSKALKEQSEAAREAEKALKAWQESMTTRPIDISAQIIKGNAAAADEMKKRLDAEMQAALDEIKMRKDFRDQDIEIAKRAAEKSREMALDTAYDIADIIGGRVGDIIGNLADVLNKALPSFAGKDGKVPKWVDDFSKVLGKMGVGAKIGSSVDGIFDAIGIKSSKTGAQLGGAIGQFAGPLGAIAGSIVGGIVGGMMKSTPRASATVSIIAGEAMETAIKGSSSKLKAIAGEMASGLVSGLEQIAETLGAQLTGDAKVSLGTRNGKYRVDTSGSGKTKTSKGAIDFGEDKAAAIAFALQDAIKDGVLGGLSASLQTLITKDGDLQTQLQKALSFKGVFDELAKNDDPAKYAQDEITRWNASMAKIFAEAGATSDELAALERLTGIKRMEAAKDASEKIVTDERGAHDKRIRILELEGKAQEAVAYAQGLELASLNEVERALQVRIYQLESEAEAAAKVQAIADERYALETRYYTAIGDTEELRRRELLTVSEANREFYNTILALEGLRDAAKEAAEEMGASIAKRMSDQKSVEMQILQLTDGERYLKATREDELRSVDASVRPLLMIKYAREDEIKLLEKQKAIADERYDLETQWFTLIGNQAALRDRQLAKLDPANRDLQKQIWAEEDRQAALEGVNKALEEQAKRAQELASAHAAITDKYTQEANALAETAQRFRDFGQAISEFRANMLAQNNPAAGYGAARSRFLNTSRMAAFGDEKSLGSVTNDAQAFLDLARERSGSYADYQREVAMVASELIKAQNGANGVASEADRQAEALRQVYEKQTAELELAIANIGSVQTNIVVPALTTSFEQSAEGIISAVTSLQTTATEGRTEQQSEARSIAGFLSDVKSILLRVEARLDETLSVDQV